MYILSSQINLLIEILSKATNQQTMNQTDQPPIIRRSSGYIGKLLFRKMTERHRTETDIEKRQSDQETKRESIPSAEKIKIHLITQYNT